MMISRITFSCITTCVAVWLAVIHCTQPSLPKRNIKYILSWVPFFGDPYFAFGDGSTKVFIQEGCNYSACEIVADRHRVPLEDFDALMFHGYEYYKTFFGTPITRRPEQIYVFMSLEAQRRSDIPEQFTNFYNLSMTYRLDSDIMWPYYSLVDKITGVTVAPYIEPNWQRIATKNNSEAHTIAEIVSNKRKAAAWFVSHCNTNSGRDKLAKELSSFGIEIDIYGKCGNLQCPVGEWDKCVAKVGQYYFYLAFENSICTDYVTEKVVTALQSGAVPVILSGANLSSFLPPGSYLDARKYTPKELAEKMNHLMQNPLVYAEYLFWRHRYKVVRLGPSFKWPKGTHPFCQLCEKLHVGVNRDFKEIRSWWRTSYLGKRACV